MTARTIQELYDRFCSGGSPKNSISQIEQEFEDLIDTIFSTSSNFIPFVHATHGYDSTNTAQEYQIASSTGINGIWMLAAEIIHGGGYLLTPSGWTGTLTVTALYRTTNGTGNLYMQNYVDAVDYFTPALGSGDDSGAVAFVGATAAGACKVLPVSVSVTSQAIVRLRCKRYGSNELDTFNQAIFFIGWEIGYS